MEACQGIFHVYMSTDLVQKAHLWKKKPSEPIYTSTQNGDNRPGQPIEYRGTLDTPGRGHWRIRSDKNCRDCSIISLLPLYYAMRDSPMMTERVKTIYFEVTINKFHRRPFGGDASGFSLGFVAQPYPSWRSPGWDRASVGVFSDDGCRFVNDNFGGKEFTTAFRTAETVGIGMRFSLPAATGAQQKPVVRVFFTRGGAEVGAWDLHEELDSEAEGVNGLEGDFDLYAAVGVFGGVDVEVKFGRERLLFKHL